MNTPEENTDFGLRGEKRNPFHVNPDYFDSFESKLSSRLADQLELEEIAPTLAGISRRQPFTVSSDYFDELPTIVSSRVVATRTSALPEWLTILFRPRTAIPLMLVFLFAFGAIRLIDSQPEKKYVAVSAEEELFDVEEFILTEEFEKLYTYTSEEAAIRDYLLESPIDITTLADL